MLSIKKIHDATVNTVAKKTRAPYKREDGGVSAMREWDRESRIRLLVLADAEPADERQPERGLEEINTEIQAEQIQFESFFTPHGDA